MPMAVNSPTACGRSPLGEGALGRGEKSLIVECYTISAVDKSPKIWYNKKQGTRKERKEDGTL